MGFLLIHRIKAQQITPTGLRYANDGIRSIVQTLFVSYYGSSVAEEMGKKLVRTIVMRRDHSPTANPGNRPVQSRMIDIEAAAYYAKSVRKCLVGKIPENPGWNPGMPLEEQGSAVRSCAKRKRGTIQSEYDFQMDGIGKLQMPDQLIEISTSSPRILK
jgi:hypothetical protein